MLNHKSKQYLIALLKVTLVITAIAYIYYKVTTNNSLSSMEFKSLISGATPADVTLLLCIFSLSFLNWGLEILKWKTLAEQIRKTSFRESSRQVLSAQTFSLLTPMKIGEYGAKTFYYPRKHFKKVLFLNFLGSLSQLAPTLFFGSIGLWFFISLNFPELLPGYAVFLAVCTVLFVFAGKVNIQSISETGSFSKIISALSGIPHKVKENVLLTAFLRYTVFALQFCFLLNWFTPVSLWEILPGVLTMYLISSALPVLQFFDVLIKGSVAVFVFSAFNEFAVMAVVALMWLLNTVLPAVVGSYFVVSFNTRPLATLPE